ncbi:MAG: protein kinase domain-containing protein [Acidobacteriota bacterium]
MRGRIGDYAIERELPAAGPAAVFHATHVLLPRRAIVRVLRPPFATVRPAAVELMREACLIEALRHPGVPRVYECGRLGEQPWIACEHVEGEHLADTLDSRCLRIDEVIALVRDVAGILAHAHTRGIVHRNLRPEAIVRGDGKRGFPLCLVDWSSARVADDGSGAVLARGAIAHLALAGELPGPEQPLAGPPRVVALIQAMLAPEAAARPTAARVAAEATRLAAPELEELDPVDVEEIHLPPPIPTRVKWTPPHGVTAAPDVRGIAIGTIKRRP